MFDVFCPTCSGRRLIFSGQVRGLANTSDGIQVRFECWCGRAGTWSADRETGASRVVWPAPPREPVAA